MQKIEKFLFYSALALIVYMPLHVFIVQSASLLTGGLDVWKAGKDVFIALLVPTLLYVSYRKKLFQISFFRWFIILGAVYTLLHVLYLLFDASDHNPSTILATAYNTRLLAYLLLGFVVGSFKKGERYLKYLVTASVITGTIVAAFGVAQYFLPHDMLESVGYSVERGIKPMFFIDDRPELPRVMSTLKDPNSLGAYLIMPILFTGYALRSKSANTLLFIRPFRRKVLAAMLSIQLLALWFTFSRGALLGLFLSVGTLILLSKRREAFNYTKKYALLIILGALIIGGGLYGLRNTQIVQDYVFHAAVSTNEADPNQKRLDLQEEAIGDIVDEPEGHGPGTAGLVAIRNPQAGLLTENYYLQIAYEVGWLGITLFISILVLLAKVLLRQSRNNIYSRVVLSALVAYGFYSLLIHFWSNEAVALQWWLITGAVIGTNFSKKVLK